MKKNSFQLFIVLITALISMNAFAQPIGKIFNKNAADSIFGKVFYSQTISKAKLDSLVSDSTDVLMFKVTDADMLILNKARVCVYPGKRDVAKTEPFYAYSKSMIKELLDSVKTDGEVFIQQRGSTTTLTYGDLTLEQAWLCPPFCQ